jgi:acetoin utilization protein AcuB
MDRLEKKRRQVIEALGETERLERQGGLSVGQVMTVSPSCVTPELNALELIKLFHAKGFRHLLVTQGERLVGVISDRDVIRCLGPGDTPQREVLAQTTAADVMSVDLVTVGPEMLLEKAAALMLDEGISCLPVVREGTLLGILTNTDLHVVLQALLQTIRHASLAESIAAGVFSQHN